MLTPGRPGDVDVAQSSTVPLGCAVSPGVSCCIGVATRSWRTPRWVFACSDSSAASRWKRSKSVLASHGGSMAGENAWTKGCMSVDDRSFFSYHVAAGRTMSERRVVDVIRKSADRRRSSLPSGAFSCHRTSLGRGVFGDSVPITLLWVPRRCRRKYSLPFADDPIRFDRHRTSVRGQFSGASTSLIDGVREPSERCCAT